MSIPFFSVVIPLYNKENFITSTLHSVLAQTFVDFEVIVVNDVSTDNSVAAAKAIQDERIRIIDHPFNKGLSASRNTGIKNATAPFVAFLDADDLWKPQFLEKIHELITSYPEADIFATKYEEVYPDKRVITINAPVTILDDNSVLVEFFKANLGKLMICFSCICVRKNVFEEAGYFDENITYGEDIDFYIRANYKHPLAYYNKSLACYMIYSQQQMSLAGLKNKIIPDFDKYEYMSQNRPDIKRFLNFYRYFMAKSYRLDGDRENFKKMIQNLDFSNLNYKQRLLLKAPVLIVKMISGFKKMLLKKGIVVNSYD